MSVQKVAMQSDAHASRYTETENKRSTSIAREFGDECVARSLAGGVAASLSLNRNWKINLLVVQFPIFL